MTALSLGQLLYFYLVLTQNITVIFFYLVLCKSKPLFFYLVVVQKLNVNLSSGGCAKVNCYIIYLCSLSF